MQEPNFEVCIIVRNEEETLPRMINSLKEFQERGGIIRVLDTGSTDKTAEIARSLNCIVEEVGKKFIITIDKDNAEKINKKFIKEGEEPIVKEGETLFDYASARNYLADTATSDMIATPDADEIYTKFDIDKINKVIEGGAGQLEYEFVFSHDAFGGEAIKFKHCKFYNRKKLHWVGKIHEILAGDANRVYLDESIIKLEHYQNEKTNRGGYLKGLALDCYENPTNDRNLHYLMRELLYIGRYKSAIDGFKKHIAMKCWPSEAAQSAIFIGTCYGFLNNPEEQVSWYSKGFYMDSGRREALIQMAAFYLHNKNYQATICYAKAALEIAWTDSYMNDMAHYENYPHFLLYSAYGWIGNIEEAKFHINKALEYQPLNSTYLRDIRFYTSLPSVSVILPNLGRPEGLKRAVASIKALNYPQELIDIKIIEGEETVPQKVKKGVEETKGEYICYAANDMELTPDSLILNIMDSIRTGKGLIAFDTVEVDKNGIGIRNDEGYTCEHFIIKRSLVDIIGEVFDTDFKHYCVDDLLWKKCEKINEAMIGRGRFIHYHPSRLGSGIEKDWINEKALSFLDEDRKLLAIKKDYPTIYHKLDLRKKLPKNYQNMKVLNIGVGDMSSGLACQLPYLRFKSLHNIEIHQPYIDSAAKKEWLTEVTFENKDMRKVDNYNEYDLIMVFDVFEHLTKEESISIIKGITKPLLVFGPLEKDFRHNHFEVESQDHLSLWTEQDFKDLGFETELLVDFHEEEGVRFDALWAWKNYE